MTKYVLEIERQIGALQNEGLTGKPLALLNRCVLIIKGFENEALQCISDSLEKLVRIQEEVQEQMRLDRWQGKE